tara:strand:+ start:3513 stop:4142 length:630 start_codon:yes stop_codon:yes gene_type:complete
MKVEVGQRVPMDVVWNVRVRSEEMVAAGEENPYEWQSFSSGDYFAGKRVILFSLPGAFTPTCSAKQLPGYEQNYQAFRRAGVDEIYCLSVNDSFTMNAWFRYQRIENVKPIGDGSGQFTKQMGALVDKDNLTFGNRSWRYSVLLNDGIVETAFVEDGFQDNCPTDPFEVSDAATMYDYVTNKSSVVNETKGRQLELELHDSTKKSEKFG